MEMQATVQGANKNMWQASFTEDTFLQATWWPFSAMVPLQCYLEGIFAVYVVIKLNWRNDITGKRDASKHRLFSAV